MAQQFDHTHTVDGHTHKVFVKSTAVLVWLLLADFHREVDMLASKEKQRRQLRFKSRNKRTKMKSADPSREEGHKREIDIKDAHDAGCLMIFARTSPI